MNRNKGVYLWRVVALAAGLLLLMWSLPAMASTSTIDVSQPTQMTSDSHYERGNSVLKDSGGNYWLFYGRHDSFTGNYGTGNPDNHQYTIYFKKATTIAGLATATAQQVGNMPGTTDKIYQGQTSCVEYGSKIWVFGVDMGDGGGQVKAWTTADGGSTWSVSDVLPDSTDPFEGTHLWATIFDSKIWLAVNRGGDIDIATYDTTNGWHGLHEAVDHEGMPRLYVDGSTLYLYYTSWALPAYYIYEYSAGPTYTLRASITGTTDDDCDPVLTKVGSDYVFIFAPWNSPTSRQHLKYWKSSSITGFDSLDQTTARMITNGGYGGTNWVDMWPATLTDGSDVYMFYGSEANGTTRGTGNTYMLELDWTLGNDHYLYIQNAINAATSTTINVAAGTYNENITINKHVDIVGAGSSSSGTVISQNPAGAGDNKIGVVQLAASGASDADPLLLKDLRIDADGMAGISVGRFTESTGVSVSYVKLDNVHVVGHNVNPNTEQERGLYVDKTSSFLHLTVTNGAFDNLTYGWYLHKDVSADTSTVQYVDVTNTSFSHNNHKGIYAEKLSDATFTLCLVDENGFSDVGMPSYFVPWMSGIDVNLKAGTYSNLSFIDCTITDNALGGASEGVGLTVKGRGTGSDSSNYALNPATVSNVTIDGCTITGNERGVRFGEPGKDNTGPTNITVHNSTIAGNVQHYSGSDGSAYGGLIDARGASDTIDAEDNWWGSANGPEHPDNTFHVGSQGDAAVGDVDFVPWLDAAPPGGVSFAPVTCDNGTFYASLQAGVDGCPAAGTVTAADGLFVESNTTVSKQLTVQGQSRAGVVVAPAAEDTGTIGSTFDVDYQHGFMVTADDVVIRNLTVDGTANNTANGGTLPDHYNFRVGILNYADGDDGYNRLRIEDVNIYHIRRRGIALWPATTSGHMVSECSVDGIEYQQAIYSAGYDVVIAGNQINDAGAGIGLYPSLGAADAGSFTVTDNTLTDIGAAPGRYYGNTWPVYAIYYRNSNYDKTVDFSGNVMHSFVGGGTGMPGVLGMYVYNADSASVISGNTIDTTGAGVDDGGDWGIYLGGCAGTTVSGNDFVMDEDDSGIYLGRGNGDPGLVVPNVVTGNSFASTGSYSTWTPPSPPGDSGLVDGTAIVQSDDGHVFWMGENPYHTRNTITGNTIDGFAMGMLMLGNGWSGGTRYEVEATIGGANPADSNDFVNCGSGVRIVETDGATGGHLVDATISGNATTISGNDVGIDVDGGTATIEYNTITNNTTGVLVHNGGTATIHYNNISGNTSYGVNNTTGVAIDAQKNWWGDATGADHSSNPHGTGQGGDVASDDVDFVPWYATSTTSPTSENVETVHGGSTLAWSDTVQGGVDAAVAGDTVSILVAGTYEEQVEIDKDLTLTGLGDTTVIQAPDTVPTCATSSYDWHAIVCVTSGATATVQDLKIDGAGKGNGNSKFMGIAFRNAAGTVDTVTVVDIRDTPFSGAQHGVALNLYNDDTTSRKINVYNSTFTGFQKNAMALNSSSTTPLIVDIQGNTITGAGTTTVTAQNGIQVWGDLNSGLVAHNTIGDIAWAGGYWVSCDILNYYADLDILDNDITDAQVGIYNIDGSGAITWNDVTVVDAGDYSWGIIASDPPHAVPTPFGNDDIADGRRPQRQPKAPLAAGVLTVDVSDNTVAFVGSDNTARYGIEFDAGYGPDDLVGTAHRNTVTGFEAGIEVWKCTSGCDTGEFVSITAHDNCLSGNDYGMRSNASYITVDGESNWWDDPSGPYHSVMNPSGTGDEASGYVDFEPWITDGCGGSATATTGNWLNVNQSVYSDLETLLDNANPGDTIRAVGAGVHSGGGTVTDDGVIIDLNGKTVGRGSPFLTVSAQDVKVLGPGTIDGDPLDSGTNSSDPAILVTTGGDNFTLKDAEVKRWENGVQVSADLLSFKIVDNWFHSNMVAGLQIDIGRSLGGVVTIEGNLFKDNGSYGIQNQGVTDPLPATYNSWRALNGPSGEGTGSGDAVSTKVTWSPFTYVEFFFDMDPDSLATERFGPVGETFDVALKADAVNLSGFQFVFTYDTTNLTLNGLPTFSAPWTTACTALSGLDQDLSGTDEVGYRCYLVSPPVWTQTGGTIATVSFTSLALATTDLDILHQEANTNASTVGGAKIYVNNAGYGDASTMPERDITDTEDGRIAIIYATYDGYIDLQGNDDDSGAVLDVYDDQSMTTRMASGISASSGKYTAHYVAPNVLTFGNTYWFYADASLYLPTTAVSALPILDGEHYHYLDTSPYTTLTLLTLLGGDATDDNVIDIGDGTCIGGGYEQAPRECDPVLHTGWTDVNGDGKVSIGDLTLMGGNFYEEESDWDPSP